MNTFVSSALIGTVLALLIGTPAVARHYEDGVRACSRYGNGCVDGAVRHSRDGRQVRMPGGTWIGCAGDCRRKLADETIDFWDKRKDEQGGHR